MGLVDSCHVIPQGYQDWRNRESTDLRLQMKLKRDLKARSSPIPGNVGHMCPWTLCQHVTTHHCSSTPPPQTPTVSSCLRDSDPSALVPLLSPSWVLQDGKQAKTGGASHEYGGNRPTYWDLKLEWLGLLEARVTRVTPRL